MVDQVYSQGRQNDDKNNTGQVTRYIPKHTWHYQRNAVDKTINSAQHGKINMYIKPKVVGKVESVVSASAVQTMIPVWSGPNRDNIN